MPEFSPYGCFKVPYLVITGDCSNQAFTDTVLNRLPGLTTRRAADLANEEYVRGITMLRDLEKEAIDEVQFRLIEALKEDFLFRSVIGREIVGHHYLNNPTYTAVSDEVGIEMTPSRYRGRHTLMQLESLEIGVDADTTITLNIHVDGADTTQEVDLVAGAMNDIYLDLEGRRKIRVTFDPEGVGLINSMGSSGGDCYSDMICGGCVRVRSVQEQGGNYILASQPNGMIANASCLADICPTLRKYAREIAPAVRLYVGILTMKEHIASDRINPLVANGKDQAKDLLTRWEGGTDTDTGFARSGEFQDKIKLLASMLSNYLQREASFLFDCEKLKIVDSIP